MLKNYTAYFVVEYCYDGELREEAGFYPADTFAEAMEHIEKFYGDDLITVKHLEMFDTSLMVMQPEVAKEIVSYNFS